MLRWVGSGNVQCLDVLRALSKTPAVLDAFFAEVAKARGAQAALDRYLADLATDLKDLQDFEYRARDLVDRMALAFVSDAFCHSRLARVGHHNYGTLPRDVDCAAIIARATPKTPRS